MKSFIFLIITAVVAATPDVEKWEEFKVEFHKSYTSAEEEANRFAIFQNNLRTIEEHNEKFLNGKTKHEMGVTRFADQTQEEFFDKKNTKLFPINKRNLKVADPNNLKAFCWEDYYNPRLLNTSFVKDDNPTSIDYRDQNLVLEPRDMGSKSVDFAYSIAANLEVALAIHNGTLEYLSPQYLLDCSDTLSLSGGFYRAFYNGLPRDVDYPLRSDTGSCTELCNGMCFAFSVLTHESIIENMVGWVGPVTIYFDGGDLALYKSGIIDGSNCPSDPDQWEPQPSTWRKPYTAVIVGYGTEDGTDYWILKNSLGTSWGEKGYFRLIKGQLACGIEAYPVAPHYGEPVGTCMV